MILKWEQWRPNKNNEDEVTEGTHEEYSMKQKQTYKIVQLNIETTSVIIKSITIVYRSRRGRVPATDNG